MQARDWTALGTMIRKETARMFRIWPQTFLPPVITMVLYFLIFGSLIGPRIGTIDNYSYMQFIAPGLIMMSIITNAYGNVSTSFFGARFIGNIEEMLTSPMPNHVILLGFIVGGVIRGLLVGILIAFVALGFTHLQIHHVFSVIGIAVLTAILFSLAGFSNGLFARNFDDISIIPTFVLTPLTYLGGVFYSLHMLPSFWQTASRANPILYMVNGFRYGILGVSDVNLVRAVIIICLFIIGLYSLNMRLLNKGVGVRT